MKTPHFFKAYSRIGLANPPIYTKEPNLGVEFGSDAVLSETFLQKNFPKSEVDSFTFPNPETIPSEEFIPVLTKSIADFQQTITKNLKDNQIQVVIGGEHTVTLPSVLAVIERVKDVSALGYIQFDSHSDINLYGSSISKNFHGMYVRPLVDTFDLPEIDAFVPHKLPPQNMLYIGNMEPYLDAEEKQFLTTNNIKNMIIEDLREKKEESLQYFQDFIKRFSHIHVTFDIDCLDQTIAPATGLPAEQGLLIEDITELLTMIAGHPSFSLDLVEVNPKKPGAEQTIKTAQKVLSRML